MNKVSIIINGVRYDAVDSPLTKYTCSHRDVYDYRIEPKDDLSRAEHNVLNKIFKKSDKSLWYESK